MNSFKFDPQILPPYVYRPLQDGHFRFIELLPGAEGDPIRIRIFHSPIFRGQDDSGSRMSRDEVRATLPHGWYAVELTESHYLFINFDHPVNVSDLHPDPDIDPSIYLPPVRPDNIPKYEALSYAWGTNTAFSPLVVDEGHQQPSCFLLIRSGLMVALEHLRTPNITRTLWIDAICINQVDNDEKATQVTRMGSIFHLANRVVIWLGPEEADSEIALSALNKLGDKLIWTTLRRRMEIPEQEEEDWYYPDHQAKEAINNLIRRPWFSRLWVVQEAQLASSLSILQCGHSTILLRRFVYAIGLLKNNRDFYAWEIPFRLYRKLSKNADLKYLLRHLGRLECSDPRDKIYGMLGLLPQDVAKKIRPDYEIPERELYKQVTLMHASHIGSFDLWFDYLVLGEGKRDFNNGMPSWVPDWTLNGRYFNEWHFTQWAAGLSRANFKHEEPGILTVTGVMCDTVATISQIGPAYHFSENVVQWLLETQPPLDEFHHGIYRPTGDPVALAYIATISEFQYQERQGRKGEFPTIEEWKSTIYISPGPGAPLSKINMQAKTTKFCFDSIINRRYIRTEKGYMGLSPAGVKPGDRVVVLLGCNSSIVLRPRPDGCFSLIGEATIYGLHDGRALLGPIPSPWKSRIPEDAGYIEFVNEETGEFTKDDPRLAPLGEDSEWLPGREEIYSSRGLRTRLFWTNKTTGEWTIYDPRMRPDALRERGVDLVEFQLR